MGVMGVEGKAEPADLGRVKELVRYDYASQQDVDIPLDSLYF